MSDKKLWSILVAAGAGSRMQAEIPKQYLIVNGMTILECSLIFLSQIPCEKIIVVINKNDVFFENIFEKNPDIAWHKIVTVIGGDQRSDSVYNGLQYVEQCSDITHDIVLIHDAARPCADIDLTQQLYHMVQSEQSCSGGILAIPVTDTIKRVDEKKQIRSVSRDQLWRAQTPQIFKINVLIKAFEYIRKEGIPITDESMAVEQLGSEDLVILESSVDNLKVTYKSDLYMVRRILNQRYSLEK